MEKFRYNNKVRIIKGFYTGLQGKLVDIKYDKSLPSYLVKIIHKPILKYAWISEEYLDKIEGEK